MALLPVKSVKDVTSYSGGGAKVGDGVMRMVGLRDGKDDGKLDGMEDGKLESITDGISDTVGSPDGTMDGKFDGTTEGNMEDGRGVGSGARGGGGLRPDGLGRCVTMEATGDAVGMGSLVRSPMDSVGSTGGKIVMAGGSELDRDR